MSQHSIVVSHWLDPTAHSAELTVFDAENCGDAERITLAVYSGPTTTHLRMTLGEVGLLIDALNAKLNAGAEAA
jgi:hypothetical protein